MILEAKIDPNEKEKKEQAVGMESQHCPTKDPLANYEKSKTLCNNLDQGRRGSAG